jgi:hypothetical protein
MNAPAQKIVALDDAVAASQTMRLEQLLTMSRRISDAIAADIAAIEKGNVPAVGTSDPEIEKLCAHYGREVAALKSAGGIKHAPPALIAKLRESGARMKKLLSRHERLVLCMREASEGLVKAVAEEVEKTRLEGVPYTAHPGGKRGSGGAIVYNKVI